MGERKNFQITARVVKYMLQQDFYFGSDYVYYDGLFSFKRHVKIGRASNIRAVFQCQKKCKLLYVDRSSEKIKLTQCIEHDGVTIIGFQEMLIPVLSFYVQNKASNYVNCLLFRPGDQK